MSKEYSVNIDNSLGTCIVKREDFKDLQGTISGVLKFRNIKYASIPYRWASPRLINLPLESEIDLTEYGPQCPQTNEPLFNIDNIPLFGKENKYSIPIHSKLQDEFECLNLNIFAPCSIDPLKDLPVLIWVHGGAYCVGSGGTELYDGTKIVLRSIMLGRPTIVVTLNYRLGVLGFLHSPQLVLEASLQDDVPPEFRSTGNLGILDCYQAINWVKNNISCFGGDPKNITGSGESAGAGNYMSLLPHVHPHIPQMILSSSTIFSNQLLLASEATDSFYSICEELNIDKNDSSVVKKLRDIPVETIVSRTSFCNNSFRPMRDGISIPYDPRDAIFRHDLWDPHLERIIFGHCENESWLRYQCAIKTVDLARLIIGRIPESAFRDIIDKLYRTEKVHYWHEKIPIFKALDEITRAWITLDGHARYYGPPQALSNSFASSGTDKVVYKYVCSWNTHHWPKSWPATHTADILPLFLHSSLFRDELAVACSFLDPVISFVNGEKLSWPEYSPENSVFNILGRDGTWRTEKLDDGIFGLSQELITLWCDIVKSILYLGEGGWKGMAR